MKRPDPIVLISLYHWLRSVFSLGWIAFLSIVPLLVGVVLRETPEAVPVMAFITFGSAVGMACAWFWVALHAAVGWGIWTLRPWGRWGAIVLAVLDLWNVPIGTVIGTLILWYLFGPEGRAVFETPEKR